jgi:acetyl-CoA carboxylase carboxyl transferase subunit alpha
MSGPPDGGGSARVNESSVSAAWERVTMARHPERPYALDYIARLASGFHELRGDRLTGDDPALVAGLGSWHGRTVAFIGQQKGRSMRERVTRNYGMMHPEGYRKAIRVARLAGRFQFPIFCLIDTPGAFPGAAAEERGIAIAIAEAIREWFAIPTPVIATVIGEGGSGGALGIGVADRVLMLENATYSVASPEACASILWRGGAHEREAAEQLGLTAERLLELGVVDGIVPEPPGGAHRDHGQAARLLDLALQRHLAEVEQDRGALLRCRYQRFRRMAVDQLRRGA